MSVARLAALGTLSLIVVALVRLIPPPLDYGRCLASHNVHHHLDASYGCAPGLGLDGEIGLQCGTTPPQDWDETICDEWEFPHGRAER